MVSKSLFFISAIFLFSASVYAGAIFSQRVLNEEKLFIVNDGGDSLGIGRYYDFVTKMKKQYTGKYLGSDMLFYRIMTEEGKVFLKKDDVLIINEKKSGISKEKNISDSSLVNIELKDGNSINGYIISQDSAKITFGTKSKIMMVLPRSEIVRISKAKIEYVDGEYFIQDPNDARLFLAPTARPIRKNSGFLSDAELLFPMAGVGIENVVSLVGGISIVPFSSTQLMYMNAKVTPVHLKNVDLAAGLIYFNGTSNSEGLTIGYTGGTFGSPRASITAGFGMVFKKNVEKSPMIIIGGELRADNNIKFIMENWILTYKDAPAFSLLGIRFFSSQIAADFALLKIWERNSGSSGWPFIPYVSFTYNLDFN